MEEVKFDFKAIFNGMFNHIVSSELKKDDRIKPIVEVLEKYGVKGMDVIPCMLELSEACKKVGKDNDL